MKIQNSFNREILVDDTRARAKKIFMITREIMTTGNDDVRASPLKIINFPSIRV